MEKSTLSKDALKNPRLRQEWSIKECQQNGARVTRRGKAVKSDGLIQEWDRILIPSE